MLWLSVGTATMPFTPFGLALSNERTEPTEPMELTGKNKGFSGSATSEFWTEPWREYR
jgi:hypothetical protein